MVPIDNIRVWSCHYNYFAYITDPPSAADRKIVFIKLGEDDINPVTIENLKIDDNGKIQQSLILYSQAPDLGRQLYLFGTGPLFHHFWEQVELIVDQA